MHAIYNRRGYKVNTLCNLDHHASMRVFFGLRPSMASIQQLLQVAVQSYTYCGERLPLMFNKQPKLLEMFEDEQQLLKYFQEKHIYTPQDLHLTLYFLGKQPTGIISRLCSHMLSLQLSAVSITTDTTELGVLPYRKPRLLVQHMQQNSELQLLREDIAKLMRENRLVPDMRSFRPHISLLQLKTAVCQVVQHNLLAGLQQFNPAQQITYDALVLYASCPRPLSQQQVNLPQRYIELSTLKLTSS